MHSQLLQVLNRSLDQAFSADVNLLGEVNALTAVELIRLLGPISRAELSRRTQLKPAALTGIVRNLLQRGLVIECEETPSGAQGGRPARMLRLNTAFRTILGIDLEPDHLRAAVTDLGGATLNYRQMAVDRHQKPEALFKQIVAVCREMGLDRSTLGGVGVSCAGLLDHENGIVLSSTNLPKWKNVPIRAWMQEEFGVPVLVGRSIHHAAWAEYWFRTQEETGRMLLVTMRTGVGFALIDNGNVYHGRDFYDGELGHTLIDIDGPQCECGRRGCLEAFISPASITTRIQRQLDEGRGEGLAFLIRPDKEVDPELVYGLARDGHPGAREIVLDLVSYISIGIGNLVNLLNPDRVVLCGAIEIVNEPLLSSLKTGLSRHCLAQSWQGLEVRSSRHAERSALLGAAMRAAQFYITSVIQNESA